MRFTWKHYVFAASLLFLSAVDAKAATPVPTREPHRAEMPLMYDVRGVDPRHANLVVERLVRDSLKRDTDGNAFIQGSPCTTPNNLRDSILAYHPDLKDAIPTVKELPDFLHVLIPSQKPAREMGLTGTFTLSRMQCLKPGSLQQGDRLDQVGFDRQFQPGEYVWYHPNHTAPVIAGDCTNVIKPVSVPTPRQVQNECFAYPVDGRGYPVKQPLELVVNFYRHDPNDLHRLMADTDCFYAIDGGTGERLRLDRECATCKAGEQEAVWPSDVAAGEKTEFIFSVYSADGTKLGFPSGYGTVYVPLWFSSSSLWCFSSAENYIGAAPASSTRHGRWRYSSYYAFATLPETVVDQAAKEHVFHRVVKPDGVLGK